MTTVNLTSRTIRLALMVSIIFLISTPREEAAGRWPSECEWLTDPKVPVSFLMNLLFVHLQMLIQSPWR